jgi:hypothetical protein
LTEARSQHSAVRRPTTSVRMVRPALSWIFNIHCHKRGPVFKEAMAVP